jgi:hypothetical protein
LKNNLSTKNKNKVLKEKNNSIINKENQNSDIINKIKK